MAEITKNAVIVILKWTKVAKLDFQNCRKSQKDKKDNPLTYKMPI